MSIENQSKTLEPISEFTIQHSKFALTNSLNYVQLTELKNGEGSLLYFPSRNNIGTNLEVGDVLFLREKGSNVNDESEDKENGVVVQVISLGTATYPHSQTKALFRIMVNVRATNYQRSHNEPPETIDELLEAQFKIRASIVDGQWRAPEGRVVTRNVDIFQFNPRILASEIFVKSNLSFHSQNSYNSLLLKYDCDKDDLIKNTIVLKISETENVHLVNSTEIKSQDLNLELKENSTDINLGFYKSEPVEFFGGGFEKINLITGMKGGGKSHIAKGIINESLKAGMSAIVFDINDEYKHLKGSHKYRPTEDFKFRLDKMEATTFMQLLKRVAPLAEKTKYVAESIIPKILDERKKAGKIPDINFLRSQTENIIKGRANKNEAIDNMRGSFITSLDILESLNIIMSENEAELENESIKNNKGNELAVRSLSSALYSIENKSTSGVIVFDIGGFHRDLQYSIVDMILDNLKDICKRQNQATKSNKRDLPNYPTVYFEEAHMYMEPKVIDGLLPLIRHYGMNVFFITNTPGALPDSVFRLLDNLIMTRMLNKSDIDQVKNCGLTDVDTIEDFAANLKEHHALLLSGSKGATKSFPLVFQVRDFKLPQSGETKSMWNSLLSK